MLYARCQLDMEDFYGVIYIFVTARLGAFDFLQRVDGKFNEVRIRGRWSGYFRRRGGVSRRDVALGESGNEVALQVKEVERRLAANGKISSRPNHQNRLF